MELRVNLTATKMNFALRKEEKKRNPFGRLEKSSRGQRKIPVWHLSKEEMAAGSIRSNRRHGSNHFVFGTRPAPFEFRGERVATPGVASPVQVFSSSSLVSSKLMLPGCDHGLLFYNDVIMVCFFLLADLVAFWFFGFFCFVLFFFWRNVFFSALVSSAAPLFIRFPFPPLFSPFLTGDVINYFYSFEWTGRIFGLHGLLHLAVVPVFFLFIFFFWFGRLVKKKIETRTCSFPFHWGANQTKKNTLEKILYCGKMGLKKKRKYLF